MDERRDGIVCRDCGTVFPLEEGGCPGCGTPVRGRLGPAIAVVGGLVVLYLSVFPLDLLPAVVGVVLVVVGARLLRDRQRREREAARQR